MKKQNIITITELPFGITDDRIIEVLKPHRPKTLILKQDTAFVQFVESSADKLNQLDALYEDRKIPELENARYQEFDPSLFSLLEVLETKMNQTQHTESFNIQSGGFVFEEKKQHNQEQNQRDIEEANFILDQQMKRNEEQQRKQIELLQQIQREKQQQIKQIEQKRQQERRYLQIKQIENKQKQQRGLMERQRAQQIQMSRARIQAERIQRDYEQLNNTQKVLQNLQMQREVAEVKFIIDPERNIQSTLSKTQRQIIRSQRIQNNSADLKTGFTLTAVLALWAIFIIMQ